MAEDLYIPEYKNQFNMQCILFSYLRKSQSIYEDNSVLYATDSVAQNPPDVRSTDLQRMAHGRHALTKRAFVVHPQARLFLLTIFSYLFRFPVY